MRCKFYLLIVTLFIVDHCMCNIEFPDDLKDIIVHIHNVCVENTGVTEDEIKACSDGKFSDRKELGCYMFCLMEEASFVDDNGVIDYDMLISMIPEQWRDKISTMISACRHLDVPEKDTCTRASDVHKCLYKTNPELYFLF